MTFRWVGSKEAKNMLMWYRYGPVHTAGSDTILIQVYMDLPPGMPVVSNKPEGHKDQYLDVFLQYSAQIEQTSKNFIKSRKSIKNDNIFQIVQNKVWTHLSWFQAEKKNVLLYLSHNF